ncbi:MAG: glycosyltransferase family 39 protein [Anaerolineaceae bacterium]|nr:glycosyltransferase family 39 protein [Anaerolineaceae bacterium]
MPNLQTQQPPSRFTVIIDWLERNSHILALLVVLLFTLSGILTLDDYGLAWDEGLGNIFLGERYYYYFQTFQQKYLDFKTELSINRNLPLNTFLAPMHAFPHEFPPVMDTLSAASMHLLSYRLGWLPPISAFHLPTVLLSGGFLWLLYRFAVRRLGKLAGFLTILFLATFPRFWGDMHFNVKDVPEAILFAAVIIAYLRWYEKPNLGRAIGTGALFGLALGVKANAVFLPFVLILAVWPLGWKAAHWKVIFQHLRVSLLHYLAMALSGGLLYFLSWPYLYADPLRVKKYFDYILSQGGRTALTGFNTQPLLMTLFTTPEWMLLFLLVGLFFAGRAAWKSRSASPTAGRVPIHRLLIVWFAFPILRTSLPSMVNFDGIRHFLEFLPAAALLAGFGAASLVQTLARQRPARQFALSALVVAGLVINTLTITAAYHPYEYLYFNCLTGGFSGAYARFGDQEASDYWGVSYPHGMQWLSENAPEEAAIYIPVAEWLVQMQSPLWLRPDIQFLPKGMEQLLEQPGRESYVMFITRSGFYNEIAWTCTETLQPVYQIELDGVPIQQIYRWEP